MSGRSTARRRSRLIIAAMVVAVASVTSLAYFDVKTSSEEAFDDFAAHQAIVASLIGEHLRMRLLEIRGDARSALDSLSKMGAAEQALIDRYRNIRIAAEGKAEILVQRDVDDSLAIKVPLGNAQVVEMGLTSRDFFSGVVGVSRPHTATILIAPPGWTTFETPEGRSFSSPALMASIQRGQPSLRLSPEEAAGLALPERTAVAGLARVDAGPMGRWGVAFVASAERVRDREFRSRARIIAAVLGVGALVIAFGSVALSRQRKELELERELQLAEAQRQRDDRLKRLDKVVTLGTIAMGVAHELSTPLGVVAGRAEQLLARTATDERAHQAVQTILDQSQRMSEIIRAFVSMARGDVPPNEAIEPKILVEQARTLVDHRFVEAGVKLVDDIPKRLSRIHGQPLLLEQALANLLLNACEACPRGGRVEVTAQNGGGLISFCIRDDGSGISEADAARATEPFFTTKAHSGGSGLGLAIVNEIAKHHGGKLVISPRPSRGTEARLELPVNRGQHHEAT